jgi:hypothetical protein
MIIRYTKAEQTALQNIDEYYRSKINDTLKSMSGSDIEDIKTEIRKLDEERITELLAKHEELEDIRFSKISRSPQKVLDNAKLQTTAILDKLRSLVSIYKPLTEEEIQKKLEENLENPKTDEELLNAIEPFPLGFHDLVFDIEHTKGDVTRLSKKQITDFIKKDLRRHYKRLEPTGGEILDAFITDAVSEALKEEPEQTLEVPTAYFRMYHDVFIDALPQMSSRTLQKNPVTKNWYITVGKTRLDITDTEGLALALGVPTHKLLITALEKITVNPSHNNVYIPTADYFKSIGYNISDPEIMKKNISRTGKYLLTMHRLIVTEDRERGRKKRVSNLSIITKTSVDNDFIRIEFNPEYVNYLKLRNTQMQYPRALLSIDARSANAYRLGYKMAAHSSNFNNIIRNSNNTLSVYSLYSVTDFPTIETVREQRKSWIQSIRNPFETALNTLIDSGVIEKWYYCKPKGKKLNPQEEETLRAKYEAWEGGYIRFTMKNAPDQTEAIQKNRDRKKAAAEKRKAREEAQKET